MARRVKQLDAKRLYCEEMKETREISSLLSVSRTAVYRWKAADKERGIDWDKEREENWLTTFRASKQLLRAAAARLVPMIDEIAAKKKISPSEVNALRLLLVSVKEIEGDEKKVDVLGNILSWLREFVDFLIEEDHELSKQLIPHLMRFGEAMKKKHGKGK